MIKYKSGFKYQLAEDYSVATGINGYTIDTRFIKLGPDGTIVIKSGYAWDGPSGPTLDTKNFMRGSLIHDALYQLMRGELLPRDNCRKMADKLLKKMCREDGMSSIRAWFVYKAVASFGGSSATGVREIETAP